MKTLRILLMFALAFSLMVGCKPKKKKSLKWVKYNCTQFCKKANLLCNNYFRKKKRKFDITTCSQGCVRGFVKSPGGISNRLMCAAKRARTCAQMRSCNKYGKPFPNRKAYLKYLHELRLKRLKKLKKKAGAKGKTPAKGKAPVKGKAADAGKKAPDARPKAAAKGTKAPAPRARKKVKPRSR